MLSSLGIIGMAERNMVAERDEQRIEIKSLILLNCILILLTLVISVAADLYIHVPSLYDKGVWTSTKTNLEKGVIGAAGFMVTKVAVAGNNLNLGAWNGFQEIIFRKDTHAYEVLRVRSV